MRNIGITHRCQNSANSRGGLAQIPSSARSSRSECSQWLWLGQILQTDPTKRWLIGRSLPRLSECHVEIVLVLGPPPTGVTGGEVYADRYP
jgi:hypothetical protein